MNEDLGFKFNRVKGEVTIYHHGKRATVLRGAKAKEVEQELNDCDFNGQQQLMARLTGNYKRGNEKLAKNHLRNKSW
ncbi:hypothetical protein [Vibrio sp. 99-8-1]|uniref:hypothetical protein n=1 Tax=Vibrio sp. 99-8-1 TaxID=2607602 RepID=UPI0014934FBC|nr:hypothetical protein [Vibrio sp. 99-8-1]NOI66984.1 hypothetical protein [Vibrio sp. 99-8-1]